MTSLLVDPAAGEESLRELIYQGDLVLFTHLPAVAELVELARVRLCEIFDPHDPQEVHLHRSPEEVAGILASWKPTFMREERSVHLARAIAEQAGLPPAETHVDLIKARTSFPVGHLTTGIAFAFPWHRDTWYAAPPQQINWWFPVYEVTKDNAMKFDLASFAAPVRNTSGEFDYYAINRSRSTTATQVRRETQSRPAAIDHDPVDPTVVLPRPGGVLLFSGTHLHASIPNTSGRSRYSIDFRTVDRRDVVAGTGAPLVDAHCTGTSLRDFVNAESTAPFDEDLVRSIHGEPPPDALLVFSAGASGAAAG